jgi:hypothetical protein
MESADLERELRGLAERVRAIEDRLGVTAVTAAPAPAGEESSGESWQVPVQRAGVAFVGVGGAYLLRAMVEAETLPPGIGVGLGVVYAMLWLAQAARRGEALFALTSALVMAPLLWEGTIRFHAIPAWAAAAVLLVFTLFGLAISWRRNLLSVATISTITGLGTAGALLAGTHDVAPFGTVILAVAGAVEISACLEHWLAERWLAAAAADAAVLLATWLVTNPHGLPAAYAPIPHGWLVGAQIALLGLYLASTLFRTLYRHFEATFFETAQCAAAFAIATWGGLPVAPGMLVAGAACYVVSFVVLERGGGRNFYTYSTFGLLLALAGTRAMLTGPAAPAVWAVLAAACCWSRRTTLEAHGAIYMGFALAVARPLPALGVAAVCFAGTAHGPLRLPMFGAAVWKAAVLAASLAPERLGLAAKLSICGAGLILLPRIKAMGAKASANANIKLHEVPVK